MPEIDVLVPYATKNYVKNPSFETNTTGWTAVGSSISAVLTRARFERKALQVVTSGLADNEGVYYRINDTTLKGNIFESIYIRGVGKVRIRAKDGLTGKESASLSIDLHDDYWQRISIQAYAEGTDDTRLYVETADKIQAVTFYIDGAQVEMGDYLSTYVDGYQPDCRWNGVKNASTSQRPASSPNGGRWVSIRDDDCDPTTYITTFSGLGLPPITINRQQMALTPGSFFDSMRVNERVIQFAVNIKDSGAQRRDGLSKVRLNKLRQHLTDLVKPDRDPNTEPMWLRYRDGDRALLIRASYESGLEFEGDFRNKWVNAIPLRFLALDPFWYEDSQEVELLNTEKVLGNDLYFISRSEGVWSRVAQDVGSQGLNVIKADKNGKIYIGGNFSTDGNGVALRRIGYLNDDYSEIFEASTGLNDLVNDLAIHPNGKVYICGDFTADNAGNLLQQVAEYDPDTNTFAALGGGIDDTDVLFVEIAPNGWVYFGGSFSSIDGGTAARGIAYWDGGAWHTVGDINAEVGRPYLAGLVVVDTDEIYGMAWSGAFADDYFVKWDGSTWEILGTLSTYTEYNMTRSEDGVFYIVGFDATAGVFQSPVYLFNGSSFEQLGSKFTSSDGTSEVVRFARVDGDGNVWVCGNFNRNGDVPLEGGVAIWNGSSFVPVDISANDISSVTYVKAIEFLENGDVLLGVTGAGLDNFSGSDIKSITSKGTAACFPIISFSGSGTITWLGNQSSGQKVFVNYTLVGEEMLTIDFRTGEKTIVSNIRGNVPNAILPGSDDLFLLPANSEEEVVNKISCLVKDEVDPVVQLRYQPTHWSVDAVANQ